MPGAQGALQVTKKGKTGVRGRAPVQARGTQGGGTPPFHPLANCSTAQCTSAFSRIFARRREGGKEGTREGQHTASCKVLQMEHLCLLLLCAERTTLYSGTVFVEGGTWHRSSNVNTELSYYGKKYCTRRRSLTSKYSSKHSRINEGSGGDSWPSCGVTATTPLKPSPPPPRQPHLPPSPSLMPST